MHEASGERGHKLFSFRFFDLCGKLIFFNLIYFQQEDWTNWDRDAKYNS